MQLINHYFMHHLFFSFFPLSGNKITLFNFCHVFFMSLRIYGIDNSYNECDLKVKVTFLFLGFSLRWNIDQDDWISFDSYISMHIAIFNSENILKRWRVSSCRFWSDFKVIFGTEPTRWVSSGPTQESCPVPGIRPACTTLIGRLKYRNLQIQLEFHVIESAE
jgi:hypothetical protein